MDWESLHPPRGYTPVATLQTLPPGTEVSVIGIVVDLMPPAPSRGSDFTCSMRIQDSSSLSSAAVEGGIQIRMFRPRHQMPERVEIGDVVLVRNTRCKIIGGNFILNDTRKDADFLFFSSASIPSNAFKAPHVSDETQIIEHATLPGIKAYPPTAAEQDYIIKLREWAMGHEDYILGAGQQRAQAAPAQVPTGPRAMANTGSAMQHQLPARPNFAGVPPAGAPQGPRAAGYATPIRDRKFANLKDVKIDSFHDLAGEVVKKWDNNSHVLDLYITDYTFNAQLFDYKENGEEPTDGRDGDPYGYTNTIKPKPNWKGPWGKHTICISMWEPHASYTNREIHEGDIVKVRNARCHVKNGRLQASLHQDRQYLDRVDVTKLSNSHELYQMVQLAKEEYWRGKMKPKNMAKAEKKKRSKDRKRKRELEEAEGREDEAPKKAPFAEDDSLFVPDHKDKVNPKVISAHPDRPLLPLAKILETPFRTYRSRLGSEVTLPFINQKCRAKLRVVDYYPPNLNDFAQNLDDVNYNDTMTSSHDESLISLEGDSSPPSRWEWCFWLRVEDPRPAPGDEAVRTNVLVHGHDAVYLLKMDATDLHHNKAARNKLYTKLWTLWGDLPETKKHGQKPSNHPFECCLDEYGVWDGDDEGNGDWIRMLRLKQTTIRDEE